MKLLTVGLDVGGTKVLGVVTDSTGAVLGEQRRPTPMGSGSELVEALAEMTAELCRVPGLERSDSSVGAVGVGVAGLVDRAGVVHYAPNLPQVRRLDLATSLAAEASLPVVVDNDANAAAWGEVVFGAARGLRHVIVVTLGTGIGGGLVVDGALCRGAHGFAAEIGHITVVRGGPLCACGDEGHWEAIAAGPALGRLGRDRAQEGRAAEVLRRAGGDPESITGRHISEAALAGDAEACALLDEYADAVSLGLAALANVLDPERIIIGGGIVEMGELLMDRVRSAFLLHLEGASERPDVPIVAATLGEHAGSIGAAALARELLPA